MRADMLQLVRRRAPLVVVSLGLVAQFVGPASVPGGPAALALSPPGAVPAEATGRTDPPGQPREGYWHYRTTRPVKEVCADQPPRPDVCNFEMAEGDIHGSVIHTPADGPKWTWGGGLTWLWAPTGSMDLLLPGDPLGLGAKISHLENGGAVGGYFRWGHLETNGNVHEGDDFLTLSSPEAQGLKDTGSLNTVVPAGPWATNPAEPLVLVAAVYHIGRIYRIYDWVDGPPPEVVEPPAPTAVPPTSASASAFTGPIRFGTSIADNQLVGEASTFPAGTARIYVYFQRQNAPGGTPYSVRWLKDGQVTNSYDYTMPAGLSPDGASWFWLGPTGGFSRGAWEVILSLNGADVLRGGFTVR